MVEMDGIRGLISVIAAHDPSDFDLLLDACTHAFDLRFSGVFMATHIFLTYASVRHGNLTGGLFGASWALMRTSLAADKCSRHYYAAAFGHRVLGHVVTNESATSEV